MALLLSPWACGEDPTGLLDLDGLWHFTFVERDTKRSEEVDWRLSIDGERVVVTPVVGGASRIEQRRSGTASGNADSFTLNIDEPGTDCSWRRVMRGRMLEQRLSGTYELQPGADCPDDADHQTQYGSFGARAADG